MILKVYFNFGLDASIQMGLDQALFENLQEKGGDIFLRFYTIEPQAFTVGYFIDIAGHCEEPIHSTGDEAISKAGLLRSAGQPFRVARNDSQSFPVVRRLTGGGIVAHSQDLVFALGARRDSFPFFKSTSESYVAIHTAIREGYRKMSVETSLVSCMEASCAKTASAALKNVCFQNPVPGDLVAGSEKVAGGAQKREKGYFLHQGSLKLKGLNFNLEAVDFSEVLVNAFAESWDLETEVEELSPLVLARARELADTKYRALGEFAK